MPQSPATALPADMGYVETDAEAAACYPIMRELRPHLVSAAEFVTRWRCQTGHGYRLLAAWRDGEPIALAGFRAQDNLLHGRHVYVDDLITSPADRRGGHGRRLLDQIALEARAMGCAKLTLGAALSNALGHRFYFRAGFLATGLSFVRPLG